MSEKSDKSTRFALATWNGRALKMLRIWGYAIAAVLLVVAVSLFDNGNAAVGLVLLVLAGLAVTVAKRRGRDLKARRLRPNPHRNEGRYRGVVRPSGMSVKAFQAKLNAESDLSFKDPWYYMEYNDTWVVLLPDDEDGMRSDLKKATKQIRAAVPAWDARWLLASTLVRMEKSPTPTGQPG